MTNLRYIITIVIVISYMKNVYDYFCNKHSKPSVNEYKSEWNLLSLFVYGISLTSTQRFQINTINRTLKQNTTDISEIGRFSSPL